LTERADPAALGRLIEAREVGELRVQGLGVLGLRLRFGCLGDDLLGCVHDPEALSRASPEHAGRQLRADVEGRLCVLE
jgi:hypothetical protein